MRWILAASLAAGVVSSGVVAALAANTANPENLSPIYGIALPDDYRKWELIAPAQEAEPLNELRAVVGNDIAVKAYRDSKLPFPDGTVLVKLAWKHTQSPEFESASIPGAATTVQVMAKDSKKYPASGGWGFGRFIDGKPVGPDARQMRDVMRSVIGLDVM
ncbi:cytochrome P460 family protein [Tardiphaga sp. 1201_B9_N1_1]|uniref:cytochrome P460 family protein n=1 Tax=unclassified Tardiphaga TaxID=2631404 RepID=UPI003F225CCE